MSTYDLVGWDDEVSGDDEYLGADDVAALLGAFDIVGRKRRARKARRGAARGAGRMPALPPRNELMTRPPPQRADRIILPMTSSGNITTSAAITARPQNVAYRPERIIVGGTPSNWLIDDIKVGNRSQFAQAGSMPAEAFAATSFDAYVSMETVQTAMDFVIQVTFTGTASAGEQFRAVVLGTAAVQ